MAVLLQAKVGEPVQLQIAYRSLAMQESNDASTNLLPSVSCNGVK